ncbi:methyltransferase domain-containing protein [Bradymonadaceae bacterium TMQ3]|uniref:Methyltransferase domain-containing protein n=1 Tax=Lujinxingia sediminis TaxID=2480984 RepID=A0ABY0CXS9_9DELT|nr:methyltransferase domain-containing protein [Lujinxingia sediminis]RDV39445.1 methyltransferase domain-containing protein [Bradymonadaceae bacterium TMQ3]RVU48509.1 methyltransferase domain-containing protein [Lujinxingia sediminis]TXC77811.1 methyltransferase domain-containing protein [Bradymonadales bacterium TMQ1]
MSQSLESPAVRAHREVVERLWTRPLLNACAELLPLVEGKTVLSAESRCGAVVTHWLKYLPEETRMMALDSNASMLDCARERVSEAEQRRIFFVQQRVNALSYADEVFEASVCLHGLVSRRQLDEGLAELARVTSSGGLVMAALPTSESFDAFYDLLDEALRSHGLHEALERLGELKERTLVDAGAAARSARNFGLHDLILERIRWDLSFASGRDFLQSPLIQETFFPHWSGAIRGSEREAVLGYITRAIDTYWRDRTFDTPIEAAVVIGRRL